MKVVSTKYEVATSIFTGFMPENVYMHQAPTPDSLFRLKSDTSRDGVGRTLLQKQRDKWVDKWISLKKTP